MVSLATLGEQFAEMGIEPEPAIIGRCLDLCTTHNITDPCEFVEQWLAFSVSHLGGAEPTLDNLAELERKELAVQTRATTTASTAHHHHHQQQSTVAAKVMSYESATTPNRKVFGSDRRQAVGGGDGNGGAANGTSLLDDVGDDLMDAYIMRTPKANHRAQSRLLQHRQDNGGSGSPSTLAACNSPLTGKTVQSYVSGQAIYTFGAAALVKNTTWASTSQPNRRIVIEHIDQRDAALVGDAVVPLSVADKYMFDTLDEKALVAADRLFDVGHQICQLVQQQRQQQQFTSNDNDDTAVDDKDSAVASIFDELVHPDAASQQSIVCVGRLCSDDPNATRLTATSTLVVSTDDRRVRSVRVQLDRLRAFALFPGQTVAIRGQNPRGDVLYADEIHAERRLERVRPPPVGEADVDEPPLSVLVVSGPYTQDDDLAYEPLHDLLGYCATNRPDVLMMCGPFVQADHAMIVDGVLVETFEAFFEKIVAEVMDKIGTDTQVIMVASSADVDSTAVYPTHPLRLARSWPNLRMVSDPSVLSINGVTFAMTATDVLQHLLEAELAHNAGERIKRAVNHLFHQASLYPLDPPQLDVGVDSELAARYAQLRTVPHVLLVPGELKCFIRDIGGCLVLNPGRLTDRKARGTFARLVIHKATVAAAAAAASSDDVLLSNYMACQVVKM